MTAQEKLETLFAKVRALPEPRQLDAIEILAEITEEEQEPYPAIGGRARRAAAGA